MSYERDNIRRMAGYVYGEQPQNAEYIKLNTNENPYPPSPAVRQALAGFDVAALRRYPPATAETLRERIATRFSLHRDQVIVTNGGDEGLRLTITTFVDPGATFGMAEPSYSLYPVLAKVQDCRLVDIPLCRDWTLPANLARQLNAAEAKLTCLVNPHAPSGALTTADEIAALAAALDGVLLIDEAYADFVDPQRNHDLAPLLQTHDNLLLLRTFSKGYSLAGLRVGFLLGAAGLIEPMLTKTRDSFNVSALGQTLATAALADTAHAQQCWQKIRQERQRLTNALRQLGFVVADSQTNFVLAQVPDNASAADIQQRLRERKILVRHFDTPRLANCLRISVGTMEENDVLLAQLRKVA